MAVSILTDKGETTVPPEIREGLKVKPNQQLSCALMPDGTATVRRQNSALDLFGSLKSQRKYPGRAAERKAAEEAIGKRMAQKAAD